MARLQMWCAKTDTAVELIAEHDHLPMNVAYIDCGRDVDKAHRLVEALVTQVFRLPLDGPYSYFAWDIDPFGELIDAPPADGRRARPGSRDRRGHMYPASVRGGCLSTLPAVCGVLVLFGLYYGLLVRVLDLVLPLGVEWATISLDAFGVTANVVIYEAVCIGLVYTLLYGFEWMEIARDSRPIRIAQWAKAGPWKRLRERTIRLAMRAPIWIAVISWFVV